MCLGVMAQRMTLIEESINQGRMAGGALADHEMRGNCLGCFEAI